jgi:hypothetical protein
LRTSIRESKELIKRSIKTATVRAILCAWALTTFACGLAQSNPLDDSSHGMNSFMGVHFGDTVDQVTRRFPDGLTQTSPYGAPAFKIENVNFRNIEYPTVTYEFGEGSGMQMVLAQFAPSEATDVYQQLQGSLGAPNATGVQPEAPAGSEASWHLSDGITVLYSAPLHRVVLIGKDGESLKADIPLRDRDESGNAPG